MLKGENTCPTLRFESQLVQDKKSPSRKVLERLPRLFALLTPAILEPLVASVETVELN